MIASQVARKEDMKKSWMHSLLMSDALITEVRCIKASLSEVMTLSADCHMPLGPKPILKEMFKCYICHSIPIRPLVITSKLSHKNMFASVRRKWRHWNGVQPWKVLHLMVHYEGCTCWYYSCSKGMEWASYSRCVTFYVQKCNMFHMHPIEKHVIESISLYVARLLCFVKFMCAQTEGTVDIHWWRGQTLLKLFVNIWGLSYRVRSELLGTLTSYKDTCYNVYKL